MKIRSLIFVPAKEKMLKKIPDMVADGIIVDLEDSIAEQEKDAALELVQEFLVSNKKNNLWVRINADRAEKELHVLENYPVGFMLPKIETEEQYSAFSEILKNHSNIALIETPLGLINLPEIVKLNYIQVLAFGAEDFTASMSMENNESNLLVARSRLLIYAKAYGKLVYDTPSFQLNDFEKFKREVQNARDMGFDGKLCINPKHIPFINECFETGDFEYIKSVIARYDEAQEAVVVIDGKVYEKMHINHMRKILKEQGVK